MQQEQYDRLAIVRNVNQPMHAGNVCFMSIHGRRTCIHYTMQRLHDISMYSEFCSHILCPTVLSILFDVNAMHKYSQRLG